jgi:two-component system, chemotaxis family, sensor kinase CheA
MSPFPLGRSEGPSPHTAAPVMPSQPENTFDAIRSLLSRIGLELAFVAPASADHGLLTDLLNQLRVAVTAAVPPAEMETAVAAASNAMVPGGEATADLPGWFSHWHPWMEEAVTAWEQARPLPNWPQPLATKAAPTGEQAGAASDARWQPPTDETSVEQVAVLPADADPEMMRLFCAEAEELLGDIEQAALVLESQPDDAETLATAFRGFHTLKGNSAVMKLVVLQRLTHEIESLLEAARRGTRQLDRDAIDVVLASADVVTRAVAEMSRQLDGFDVGRTIPLPITAVIDRAHAVLASPAQAPSDVAPPAEPSPSRADPSPVAAEAMVSTKAVEVVAAPPPAAPLTESPPPSKAADSAGDPEPTPPAASRPAVSRPATTGPSVRVDTGKLDGLVDLVGELVIAQSMVVQATANASVDEQVARSLGQLRSITRELQRTAMAMRMVPIRGTFQKMSRLVRDTAVQLGKQIHLVIEGEETELDRTVIEEIGDPLIHMLRNAADHGIESPAERQAAGKPAAGTIRLKAFHEGGFVVVEISDDGRGLDPGRIREKAVERGILPADTVLTPRDTLDLIFAPGFSTAEAVTDLSGRGVGMDVVRRNLQRVRGKIVIDSQPGSGTTFTISMPLTLAIIEGLIVAVGGQRFVIPTLAVRESFRPGPDAITTVHGRGELVDVRGAHVPLMRLGCLLGIAGEEDPTRAIVVVLEAGHDRRGLLVDELVGKQEVVIKSLGESFAGRTGFAGAAILGDGRVGLILDTAALVRPARRTPGDGGREPLLAR